QRWRPPAAGIGRSTIAPPPLSVVVICMDAYASMRTGHPPLFSYLSILSYIRRWHIYRGQIVYHCLIKSIKDAAPCNIKITGEMSVGNGAI
ncbi:MAG: hypothetical protein KBT10_05760, partial [Bacteroidales bacterium]|nr:hypothetical protein [Candidatus Sodaliphilus aphodohippi]